MSGDMTRATEKAWHTEIPACVSSLGSRGTPERRAEEISEDLIRGLEKPGFARARIMERTPLPEITQPVNGEKARYFRVNQAFKGIYVDRAGSYEVTYEYFPRGFLRSLELAEEEQHMLYETNATALGVIA